MLYEPAEDSFLLEKYVKELARGDVLDLGTGSGIQAVAAAENARSVTASDIQEDVELYFRERFEGRDIRFVRSDLFSDISGKFDTIIFNPPYLPDEGLEDRRLFGGKGGWEILERFISQSREHLRPGGIILIVFSSLTGEDRVKEAIEGEGYRFKELERRHVFFEDLVVYLIEDMKNDG